MSLFIGIDGGGTRCVAVATDRAGHELARREGGPGLVHADRLDAGAAALATLAEATIRAAGAEPPAAVLCCALAGAGREPERSALERALQERGIAAVCRVTTDAEAALFDAFGPGPGLLLISGTGSIAWGRAEDGVTARAGGWGALLGDEGSAYALGIEALRQVVRAHDGRAPDTALAPEVLRHTGRRAVEELVSWAAAADKAEIAALAPIVTAAARQGDAVARAMVDEAARELASFMVALPRRLGPWTAPPTAALAGALLAPAGPLRAPTINAIRESGVPVRILDRAIDGARGAAALARDMDPLTQ